MIAKQGGRRVKGVEHAESRAVQIAENGTWMAQARECHGAWRLTLRPVRPGAVVFGSSGSDSGTAPGHFGGAWERGRREKETEGR